MAWALPRREFISRAQRIALATPFLSLAGCGEDSAGDLISFDGATMGTTYSVKLAHPLQRIDPSILAHDIAGLLESVNQRMSTYLASSELSRFNDASPERSTAISTDTLTVISESKRLHRLTGGAFDPTVGPLVDLWGFGPEGGKQSVPSSRKIKAAAEAIGFAKVESDDGTSSIHKQTPGTRLDLSGVAKGFAVDKVAEHLNAAGIEDYLVEVGGELRASGHGVGGRPWRVGIEKPAPAYGAVQHVVHLGGEALATSGNYRIFFEQAGRRYSHIINPKTGHPVEHDLASVSVIAATTLEADALSTSLLVLGAQAGMKLAEEQEIQAFFIVGGDGSFEELASPAFNRRQRA
jgi:thiamine biosynthesis lipoprotein